MAHRRVAALRRHLVFGATPGAGNDPHRSDKAPPFDAHAVRLPWSRFPPLPSNGSCTATSTATFRTVKYEVRGGIAIITRSRPKVLNAVNFQVHADMVAAFEQAEMDPAVLCAVLTGEGRFFCSGADVAGNAEEYELEDPPRVQQIKAVLSNNDPHDSNTWSDVAMYDAWINFSKPLVIAVNGPVCHMPLHMPWGCAAAGASNPATRAARSSLCLRPRPHRVGLCARAPPHQL